MTQFTSYSTQDKILWIVGALERLATLGFLDPNVPWNVSSDGIDKYVNLDENRNCLFKSELELAELLVAIIKSESDPVPPDEEIVSLMELLVQYRDNREELVKFALSRNFS